MYIDCVLKKMCIDCHVINNIKIKYKHLVPRLNDVLDELHDSYKFYEIVLKNRYHQIKMKDEDECKTSFKTKYDLYEWLIVSLDLTSGPNIFIRLINHILRNL